jgi:hypothetical protein
MVIYEPWTVSFLMVMSGWAVSDPWMKVSPLTVQPGWGKYIV